MPSLSPDQQQACQAQGNVLVSASAGTGKTTTLVERCLRHVIEDGCSLDRILMVTFTELAAREMRERLRRELQERADNPSTAPETAARLREQLALLDLAQISTVHSLCLRLVREHFHELGLDPEVTVLDELQTGPLVEQTLDEILDDVFLAAESSEKAPPDLPQELAKATCEFIQGFAGESLTKLRELVLLLHRQARSRPHAERWLEEQLEFWEQQDREAWARLPVDVFTRWAVQWEEVLEPMSDLEAVGEMLDLLDVGENQLSVEEVWKRLQQLQELWGDSGRWKDGRRNHPAKKVLSNYKFDQELAFLCSLCPREDDPQPLQADWEAVRPYMVTLIRLTKLFDARFTAAKRRLGGVDFADLEQLALRLLHDPTTDQPTPLAREWQERFEFVLVDEYQDINAAQDALLRALSREGEQGNRFLVGDAKQSIYRFRLARPDIFSGYAAAWQGDNALGTSVSLTHNYRSREPVLDFVNAVFRELMRPELGGLTYGEDAALVFGSPETRRELRRSNLAGEAHCVELHLIEKPQRGQATNADESEVEANGEEGKATDSEELSALQREARITAQLLRDLHEQGYQIWDADTQQFRPVQWRDMVVLLRSPRGRAEVFAQEFHRLGVPLMARRTGFFEAIEVADLVNLLRLLDNPLQDIPLLAVLRSPLVGMSVEELAWVRIVSEKRPFWDALKEFGSRADEVGEHPEGLPAEELKAAASKAKQFLEKYKRWRQMARQAALSATLEVVLDETDYEAWLMSEPRATERLANVQRLLQCVRRYDPYQRQGLYRFLRFVESQEGAQVEEAPLVATTDAVRLMSVHQSKGLEFPVVALAGLGVNWNLQDLNELILVHRELGICPRVPTPDGQGGWPSLALWEARRRERAETLGEELRLLYVAMTRARDKLLLVGSVPQVKASKGDKQGAAAASVSDMTARALLKARCPLDWLLRWLEKHTARPLRELEAESEGINELFRWRFYPPDFTPSTSPRSVEAAAGGAEREATSGGDTPDRETLRKLERRLSWSYPYQAATQEPAKASVSSLRKRLAEVDEEARLLFGPHWPEFRHAPRRAAPAEEDATGAEPADLKGTEIGTAYHLVMQHLSLDRLDSLKSIEEEVRRLREENVLTESEQAVIDCQAVYDFWQSEVGRKLLAHRDCLQRELPFAARFAPRELFDLGLHFGGEGLENEFILVRGIVDIAVLLEDQIWVLDFKTDQVSPSEIASKVEEYASQLRLYAQALERIYKRPVKHRWLHFLRPGRTESVE